MRHWRHTFNRCSGSVHGLCAFGGGTTNQELCAKVGHPFDAVTRCANAIAHQVVVLLICAQVLLVKPVKALAQTRVILCPIVKLARHRIR